MERIRLKPEATCRVRAIFSQTLKPDATNILRRTISSLELPQLHELQHHVVGIQRRDDEAWYPIADAPSQDIVAQERERGVTRDLDQPGTLAGLAQLACGERAVAID